MDKGTDFTAWRIQWECYCNLSGLAGQAAEKQVEAFNLCLLIETLAIVQNLGLTNAEKKDVAAIIQALQRYVDGQMNETVDRRNFRRRTQQPGESFDDFLISLRELAKTCRFCSESCTEKSIRDQVIEGISDGDTVEHLLQENELTLATTNAAAEKLQRNTAPTSHYQKQSWWQPFTNHNSPPNTICQQAAQDVVRQFIGEGVASVQHTTRPACTATKLGTSLGYVDVSQPTSRRIPNHGINHEPMQSVSSHNNLPISITYSYTQ